jgi:ACS family hexuronate transporter-like MFS transporter
MPADLFPRWAIGSVVGLGGFAGALGGMLMAKYAGLVLEQLGSYTPIFMIAGSTYMVALAVVHILNPSYASVVLEH